MIPGASIFAADIATDIKEKKNIYVPLVGQNRGIPTFYTPQGRAMQEFGNLVGVGHNTVKKVLSLLEDTTNATKVVE